MGASNPGLNLFANQPLLPGDAGAGTGQVFWVGNSSTPVPGGVTGVDSAGAYGDSPQKPFATKDYAIGQCTAGRGDTIYILPGHAETITGTIAADVAGVRLIGLGVGQNRPTFTFTNTAGVLALSAANVEVANCIFVCNIANQTRFLSLSAAADGAYIHHNLFREGSATGLSMVEWTGAADDVRVEDNEFYAPTAGNYDEAVLIASTPTRGKILRNTIYGDFDEGGINNAGGNIATLFEISNNHVTNLLTTVPAINLDSAVTGVLADNKVSTDTFSTCIDSGSMRCLNNYWSDTTADTGGVPAPTPNLTIADSLYAILVGSGGVSAWPTAATYGNNVSIAEVLGYIQDGVRRTTGTSLPAGNSLYDNLAGANGVATFPAAAAPANGVSMAAALAAVYYETTGAGSMNTNSVNRVAVNVDFSSATWNTVAVHEVFTVSGVVRATILPYISTALTANGSGELLFGTSANTSAFIAATSANNFIANTIWLSTTGASNFTKTSVIDQVLSGVDVGYEILVEGPTAGNLNFAAWWEPVVSGSTLTAGAGGAM